MCMEKINKSNEMLYLKCHHAFHRACYVEWLQFSTYEEPICIICRKVAFFKKDYEKKKISKIKKFIDNDKINEINNILHNIVLNSYTITPTYESISPLGSPIMSSNKTYCLT